MTNRRSDLLQGTLDLLVLKAFSQEARHGYGVARWIEDVTGEKLKIEEGALYPALHRMAKRGWLDAEWGASENNRRARFYKLSDSGRAELKSQVSRWEDSAEAIFQVIKT